MDSDADAVSPHNNAQAGATWSAQSGWNKHDQIQTVAEETTPLLGSGSAGDGVDVVSGGHQWEGAADFLDAPWWRTPSMYWLLPNFFLFALAFGGIIVPKLNLILSLVCREYLYDRSRADPSFIFAPVLLEGDNSQCRNPEVQKLVSKFTLAMTVIVGCFSAVMAPKIGALSDRYGRKRFMILSSSGLFCTEIITILVYKYPESLNYHWLLVGSVVDGISGSFTAGMALTHAYAADCTPPPKRAAVFGLFHACLFAGIALGPLIAAFVIKATGEIIAIFYAAVAVHTFYIFFIAFVVPESLSKKRQELALEKHATEYASVIWDGYTVAWALRKGNILEPLKILWPTGPGSSRRLRANLILLSSVDTIIFGVAMGAMAVLIYYLGFQFGWDTADTSLFMSAVSTVRVVGLIAILPLLTYFVRTRRANRQRRESGFAVPERNSGSDTLDLNIIRTAIFFEVIGYMTYALARTGSVFVGGAVIAAFGGIGSPTLQSALTKHVPHDRVGQLLGAIGLLHALARIVAPIFFNLLYAATVDTFPQAVFVVLTSFFGVAFTVSWFIKPHVYLEDINEATGNTARTGEPTVDTLTDEEIGGY